MTATEWLFKELWECDKDKLTWHSILEKAKEMEKQQLGYTWDSCIEQGIKRAWNISRLYTDFDDFYNETFINED